MPLRVSTGLRNTALDNFLNTGAGVNFDSGVLEYRTGSQPASADDAPTGTILVSMPLPADAFAAASAGSAAKNGTWEDTSADANGTAGWFRLKTSGDGGGSSTTDRRIDGTITATGGGGQIELDNTTIGIGQLVTQSTFTLTWPASP